MSIRLKPLLWQALVCVATATTAGLLYMLFSVSDPDEWAPPVLRSHPVPARATVVVAGAVFDGSVSQPTRPPTALSHGLTPDSSEHLSRVEISASGPDLGAPYEPPALGASHSADVLAFDGVEANDVGRPQVGKGLDPNPSPSADPNPVEEPTPAQGEDDEQSPASEPPVGMAESANEPTAAGPRPDPSPAIESTLEQPNQSDGNAYETDDRDFAYSSEPSDPPQDGEVSADAGDDAFGEPSDLTNFDSFFEQKFGRELGKLYELGLSLERLRGRSNAPDRHEILSTALRDLRADRWPWTGEDVEPGDDDEHHKSKPESDTGDGVDEPGDGRNENRVDDLENDFDDRDEHESDDQDEDDEDF